MELTNTLYLLAMLAFCFAAYLFLKKFGHHMWSYFLTGVLYIPYCIWAAVEMRSTMVNDGFHVLTLLSIAIFIVGPILLAVCARVCWNTYKVFRVFFLAIAVLIIAVGIDAFCVEPHWLAVRNETMRSAKVSKPIKIAVIADIQTDSVGEFERSVLECVKDHNPDLLLWAGDYVQTDEKSRPKQQKLFNSLLKSVDIRPPMGVYVTRGDADMFDGWQESFRGTDFKVFQESTTVEENGIALTLLSLPDSRRLDYKVPVVDKFHIAVGHGPDFAMKKPPVDLIVAGHTHGGQVQIPFVGAIITLSRAPREWGGGCFTDIGSGTMLCVSRGVGMERQLAPRLRFFCRPEIVFIDVLPAP